MKPQTSTTIATYCLLALAGGVSLSLPEALPHAATTPVTPARPIGVATDQDDTQTPAARDPAVDDAKGAALAPDRETG